MVKCSLHLGLLLLSSVLFTSACAVNQPSPPAGERVVSTMTIRQAQNNAQLLAESKELMQNLAEQGVTDDNANVTVISEDSDVQSASAQSAGKFTAKPLVRWGGTIASINNQSAGKTRLEVVSRPLYGGGRPIHDDRSDGRFVAIVNAFLDPEIVKVGRDITVLGNVQRLESGTVGESAYVYPVVVVESYRYWKKRVAARLRHFPHWNTYPYRRYDPFWDNWPRHRSRRR